MIECASCKYSVQNKLEENKDLLVCERFPPQVVAITADDVRFFFPRVYWNSKCGEFKDKH